MAAVDFDAVLRRVGEFGPYQKKTFYLLCVPASVTTVFLVFSQVFVSASPDHWCRLPVLDAASKDGVPGLSAEEQRDFIIPRRNGKPDKCRMYDIDYEEWVTSYRSANRTPANFPSSSSSSSWATVPCKDGWNYDRRYYDSTFVTELNLVCDEEWRPALATTLFYLGSLVGSIFFGWVSDRFGRRVALLSVLLPDIVITILTSFSPNYTVYTVLRMVSGLFFPALYQISFILALELMNPTHRTTVGVVIAICFALGMSLLAILGHLLRNWFYLSLVTSVPLVILFSYYWLIPESPRWLLSKNRMDEAEDIVQRIARQNKKIIPPNFLARYVVRTPSSVDETERLTESKAAERPVKQQANGKTQTSDEKCVTLLDALKYPQTRLKFFILAFDWIANSVVYNGLSYNVSNLGISDHLAFFVGGVVEIPGHLITLYTMDRWGRRTVLCCMLFFGGFACVSCVLVSEDTVWLTICLAMIGKFGNAAAFSVFYVFIGELLPTVIRCQAMGVASFVAGVGLLGFPQIMRLAEYSKVLPLVVMGIFSVCAGLVTMLLPETLNTQLPQTLEEGEALEVGCGFCCPAKDSSSEKPMNPVTKRNTLVALEDGTMLEEIHLSKNEVNESLMNANKPTQ